MDRIEKMRQKQQKVAAPQLASTPNEDERYDTMQQVEALQKSFSSEKQTVAAEKPAKKKKEIGELLTHRCGHQRPIKDYTNADCGQCRSKAQKIKGEARRAKEAAERASKPRPKMLHEEGRLPDHAAFDCRYYEETKQWRVQLMIAAFPGSDESKTFTAFGSGLEKTQRYVAHQCWDFLASQTLNGDNASAEQKDHDPQDEAGKPSEPG